MKRIVYFSLFISLLFLSCKSVPSTEEVKEEVKEELVTYDIEPIYIPRTTYVVVDKKEAEEVSLIEEDSEVTSYKDSFVDVKEFIGGTSIFDYDENVQFPVITRKLSMTTIILNNDEAMIDTQPFMSDTENWQVTGDVWKSDEGERQLIMIKPKFSGLETNMLIVTNKRLYHFVLYSTEEDYQPMVRFKYKTPGRFITSKGINKRSGDVAKPHYETVDPSLLNFGYVVQLPIFQKDVLWKPEKVYDDGSHTYIRLPESVLQNEMPAVYENNDEIVNYEIHPNEHNLIIINKMVDKVTLRLGKKKVIIKKKV